MPRDPPEGCHWGQWVGVRNAVKYPTMYIQNSPKQRAIQPPAPTPLVLGWRNLVLDLFCATGCGHVHSNSSKFCYFTLNIEDICLSF